MASSSGPMNKHQSTSAGDVVREEGERTRRHIDERMAPLVKMLEAIIDDQRTLIARLDRRSYGPMHQRAVLPRWPKRR
jgi:hypothetical protein